jgi:hypothetical protein
MKGVGPAVREVGGVVAACLKRQELTSNPGHGPGPRARRAGSLTQRGLEQ